ncbi:hypothetical protein A3L09_05455 [Thermococcus profundus]|uniref:Uncharacterized protein n=1 Tax=Thermococcus profundus TaxID=49899 RepID=A0A2Z2MLA3_THEPR|nr:hypothetical protein [Thermococcus profundus]ASJ02738.1 hypothetical protein A3L09_05455 [Thermococcus profundus]
MKLKVFLRHYLKSFSFFAILVLLVSVFPAVIVATLEIAGNPSHEGFSNTYLVMELERGLSSGKIEYLRSNDRLIFNPNFVEVYLGNRTDELRLGDVERIVEEAGLKPEIYYPAFVDGRHVLLVPLDGPIGEADCYTSPNKRITKGTIPYSPWITTKKGYTRNPLYNITIECALPLNTSSEKARVLSSLLDYSQYEEWCISSGKLLSRFLNYTETDQNLKNVGAGEWIFVILPGKVDVNAFYDLILPKFREHNVSPSLYVITPEWVKATESQKTPVSHILEYLILLLPVTPAILILFKQEQANELKMREVMGVNGGSDFVVDVLTAGIVLLGAGTSFLLLDRAMGLATAFIVLVLFSLRVFLTGKEITQWREILVFISLLGVLGIASYFNMALRIKATNVLTLGLPLFDINKRESLWISLFRYGPLALMGIGGVSILPLLIEIKGSIGQRGITRTIVPSVLPLVLLFLYTGFILSTPLTSIVSGIDMTVGATGIVGFKYTPSRFNQTNEAYDAVTAVLEARETPYTTIWNAGSVVRVDSEQFIEGRGNLPCYKEDFLEFLRNSARRSSLAGKLYSLLSSNRGKLITTEDQLNLKFQGFKKEKGLLAFGLSTENGMVRTFSIPYKVVDLPSDVGFADTFVECSVFGKGDESQRLYPQYILFYGDMDTIKAVNLTASEYKDVIGEFASVRTTSGTIIQEYSKISGTLPMLLSAILMILTSAVVGARDAERAAVVHCLTEINGGDIKELFLPLLLLLPPLFLPFTIFRDAYEVYSMGFLPDAKLLWYLTLPMIGFTAGILIYSAVFGARIKRGCEF